MKLRGTIFALSASLVLAAPAVAQEDASAPTLLPQSIALPIAPGSTVPNECFYPNSITDDARFEIACVTMPRMLSGRVGAIYLGELGQRGWRQGAYISGGMTAIRTDENDCEHVLNLFPGDYPPGTTNSTEVVLWLALDRTPRCSGTQPG